MILALLTVSQEARGAGSQKDELSTLGVIAQSNPPPGFDGLPPPVVWDTKDSDYSSLKKRIEDVFDPTTVTGELVKGALKSICNATEVPPSIYPDRCEFWRPWVDGERTMADFFLDWFFYVPIPDYPAGANRSSLYTPNSPGFYGKQWDWLANTNPGRQLIIENTEFKNFMTDYLNMRGKFLSSEESFKPYSGTNQSPMDIWEAYNGTVYHPFNLREFITPDGGFRTYSDFFLRALHADSRPIGGADDPSVIVSPCDCGGFYLTLGIQNSVAYELPEKYNDTFGLADSMPEEYGQRFLGGPLLDFLLWFTDYHHFHSPVSGKVVFVGNYAGTYNYDFDNFDPNDPNRPQTSTAFNDTAQWYETINKHKRTVVIIENELMGLVAFIPVGFWAVGSISVFIKEGDILEKGDYIGYFDYGGSSILLAFEPGQDLSFVVSGLAMSTAEYPRLAKVRQSIGRLVTDAVRAEIVASTTAVSNCYIDGVTSEEPVHASTLEATLNHTSLPGSQSMSSNAYTVVLSTVVSTCMWNILTLRL